MATDWPGRIEAPQVEPRELSRHFAGNIIEAARFEALPQAQHVGEFAGCHESSGLETALH